MLVAGKRLDLGEDGFREIGEAVPEAADWRHLRPWIRSGHVLDVPAPDEDLPNVAKLSIARVLELAEERPELRERLLELELNGRRRSGLLRDLAR